MTINLQKPDITELKPRITVFGVGGGGGNAVNNMITAGLEGVDFVVANTDAQALTMTKASRIIQMGVAVTEGLGAGSQPEVGRAAAEECIDEIIDHLNGTHMCFVTAGMGGGTGTGAAPVVAQAARNKGILTVGVVTKPFHFEGQRRMRLADMGIQELQKSVDTLIVIPNQNLFRIANDRTTFADAFAMADQVLYSGVACITDLMVKEGLINLDFADVRSVMREMGRAMMGTGEASGEGRAMAAAEAAIANPLLDETSMKGAQGLLISITGGRDLTLFEVDEAATRIREEVDPDANIILGATFDEELEGLIRVSVVATGIDRTAAEVAGRNADFRPVAAKPIVRPSIAIPAAPVQQTVAVQQPAPVAQQPVVQPQAAQPVQQTSDSIAEAIRAAELERELFLSMPRGGAPAPVQQAQDDFRPQSKLFAGAAPAEQQPIVQAAPVQRAVEAPVYQQPVAQAPVRQEPVAPVIRQQAEQVRMPRVEDFPPMVKAEAEHRAQPVQHEERGPMGLLKRITNSLGRREEESHDVAADMTAGAPAASSQQRRPLSPEASVYAPRRAAPLDDRARAASQPRAHEDDQLEIPAFLRRQSN
ncbi:MULTISPECIES: cell division protein FtsZ [Rhizobium/Agrobacterium group]|jgi:cell division protein FtsZ|uniref:cell division protein FtsZ n=1 Tax=Rhizobium/Agrobacterium group TaxID=227290 RepID=UPI000712FC84|nr:MULTISPECIES: cell division protein FtsZ [Rhizobium/Agrobacterium group]KQY36190.1 cell division protein FtsZ [Rhizobium sp. Root483D2]